MSIYKELGIRKQLNDFTWKPEFTDNKGLVGVYSVSLDDPNLEGCGFSHIILGNTELTKFTYSRKRELIGRLNPYNYFILDGKLFIYLPGDPTDESIGKLHIRFSNLNEIVIEFDELGSESINTLVATFITNNSTKVIDEDGDLVTEYKSNAPYNRQWTISQNDGSIKFISNGIGELYSMDGIASCGGSVGPSSNTTKELERLDFLTQPATDSKLGTIKVGKYLKMDTDGKLNVVIPGGIIFKGGCKLVNDEGSDVHIYDMSDKPIIDFESGFKYLIEDGSYKDPDGTYYTKGDYILVYRDATDSTEHLKVSDVLFINSQESDVAKLTIDNVFTGTSNTFDGNLLVNGSTTLNGSTDVMDIEYIGESGSGSTIVTDSSSKLVTSGAVFTAVDTERVRAVGRESELDTAISNEVTRATGVEDQLRDDLSQESTNRAEQDGILQSNIDEAITLLNNEVTRATGVEDQLRNDLSQESTDRSTQDDILQSNIDSLSISLGNKLIRVNEVIDQLRDDLSQESINRAEQDSILQSNINAVSTSLSNEITRSTNAESELQSNKVDKTTTIADLDLQDNITKPELLTALNVEDGAQVNTIESIKVNGTDQSITNKSVDIIVPTGALASKDKVAESDLDNELKIN